MSKYDKIDYVQVVGSFNKLKQIGNLENYIDCFEDLRASLLELNLMITESHFLHSFISGLLDETKNNIMMFKP